MFARYGPWKVTSSLFGIVNMINQLIAPNTSLEWKNFFYKKPRTRWKWLEFQVSGHYLQLFASYGPWKLTLSLFGIANKVNQLIAPTTSLGWINFFTKKPRTSWKWLEFQVSGLYLQLFASYGPRKVTSSLFVNANMGESANSSPHKPWVKKLLYQKTQN